MAKAQSTTKELVYSEMDVASLTKELATKQDELVNASRSHKAGELVNPRALGDIRKAIARIKTALRAHELKESK